MSIEDHAADTDTAFEVLDFCTFNFGQYFELGERVEINYRLTPAGSIKTAIGRYGGHDDTYVWVCTVPPRKCVSRMNFYERKKLKPHRIKKSTVKSAHHLIISPPRYRIASFSL